MAWPQTLLGPREDSAGWEAPAAASWPVPLLELGPGRCSLFGPVAVSSQGKRLAAALPRRRGPTGTSLPMLWTALESVPTVRLNHGSTDSSLATRPVVFLQHTSNYLQRNKMWKIAHGYNGGSPLKQHELPHQCSPQHSTLKKEVAERGDVACPANDGGHHLLFLHTGNMEHACFKWGKCPKRRSIAQLGKCLFRGSSSPPTNSFLPVTVRHLQDPPKHFP